MKNLTTAILFFLVSAAPSAVQAQFTYTTNAGGSSITITDYTGPGGAVTIPTNINGLSVTGIWYWAFSDSGATTVTIPESVISLDDYAFADCYSLTNATIQYGVASISDFAFEYATGLVSIGIPSSITNIGHAAFAGCSNLSSVTIPESVASLADSEFEQCTSLTNATIAKGLTNIGYGAFEVCESLTSIYFQGNAPTVVGDPDDGPVFYDDTNATVYYLPGTTGWSNTYQGVPAVLWNPQFRTSGANFGVANDQFGFQITGTSNIPIVLQACTNLTNPVWTTLTNVNLTNGIFNFSEPLQTNAPGRYYRITAP